MICWFGIPLLVKLGNRGSKRSDTVMHNNANVSRWFAVNNYSEVCDHFFFFFFRTV
jgi:hypothetical protein